MAAPHRSGRVFVVGVGTTKCVAPLLCALRAVYAAMIVHRTARACTPARLHGMCARHSCDAPCVLRHVSTLAWCCRIERASSKARDFPELATEAVSMALADAGLPYSAVKAAVCGYCYGDPTCGAYLGTAGAALATGAQAAYARRPHLRMVAMCYGDQGSGLCTSRA